MIEDSALKSILQRELSRADKVLVVIASFSAPVKVSEIKEKAERNGCRMNGWNLSTILSRARGTTIKTPSGYEIAERGQNRLVELGIGLEPPRSLLIASDLRRHLNEIKDYGTRAFVEEAIHCYEAGLHRSAIVMSWLAATSVLHHEVITNHIHAFNAEAERIDPKWKPAHVADDLGRMKEADFLDRLCSISVIGKNVKAELHKALSLRNGCGHPNSLKVGSNTVASHIELLLLNVFDRFRA